MENHSNQSRLLIWWAIWAAILGGVLVVNFIIKPTAGTASGSVNFALYAGLAPLLVSCGLRWLILPKQSDFGKGFVVFVVGLGMAEACGFLGVFFGGEKRDELVVLGVLGVLQWMPLFARRFVQNPAANAHGLRSS